MKRKTALVTIFIAVSMSIASWSCGKKDGNNCPTCPSPPIFEPVLPSGAVMHSVPVPGSDQPFRWWISSITPPKESQVTVDQSYSFWVSCDGPKGFEYYLRMELSYGPGTERTGSSSGIGGKTDCSGNRGGTGGKISEWDRGKDIFLRFSVWTDRVKIWSAPARSPDIVVDEWAWKVE